MGRPIVYCDACGKLLREEDFTRGKAHEVDNRNFCVECRPLPQETPRTPGRPVPASPRKSSSQRTPAAAGLRPGSKTSNVPVAPAPPRSNNGVLIGLAVGGVALIGLIVAVASSGGAPRPAGDEEVRLRPAARPTSDPTPAAAEDASREPLLKALAVRRARPNDLGAQILALEEAIRALAGTRHEEDAKRELAAARQRVRVELEELDKQSSPYVAAEEFGKALNLLDASRRRYDHPDWIQGVDPLIARVRAALEKAKADIRGRADDARKRKAGDDLSRLSTRVSRWELPDEAAALAAHLVLTPATDPAPPPPPPPPPPAVVEPKRAEALAHAAARDWEAALAALGENKEDVEILRAAQAAAQEGAAALLRAPRGKKIAVDYRDAAGTLTRIDDLLLRADATRLEIKFGESSVVIPIGEVAVRTLADAVRAKDPRGAAALCWVEGDVEGAKGVALPERLKGEGPPPDEAARRPFYLAEQLFFDRPGESLAAYRALLVDQASSAFVRRNKAAIRARLEPPKEIVFLADELTGAGTFKLVPNKRVERCWTSDGDSDARKANYVEATFAAGTDKPLRAFVYLGGCCAETFTAFLQGTEMKADVDHPLKHTITGLKRKHGDHLGPKEPDRWEWVTIALPKYAEPGTKTLRILTDQKGFSVAMAMISAERAGPPRDLDPKEVERRRADIPGYANRGGLQLGSVTCEIWTGINGGGIGELRNAPGFPDRPTSRGTLTAFEIPKDTADNYGTRVLGHLYPPLTGDYVFWIASDDQGELWLSTDDDPKNKAKIAAVPEWTSPHEFEKHVDQKSKPLRLEAGRRYYIEALQKEGGGGDHLSVRWQLPDGKIEQPIPGSRLSPIAPKR
ncbi:MAG TPA: PA14 domain-containing protein [Planctomycetota bacterium]